MGVFRACLQEARDRDETMKLSASLESFEFYSAEKIGIPFELWLKPASIFDRPPIDIHPNQPIKAHTLTTVTKHPAARVPHVGQIDHDLDNLEPNLPL